MRELPKQLHHTGTVPLETERLILRRIDTPDAEGIYTSLATDPDVIDGVGWNPSPSMESTIAYIASLQAQYADQDKPTYNWLLIEKATDSIAGMLFVDAYSDERRVAEVDYCIAKTHRGHGYAPEALRAVIRHLFDTVGFYRVEAVYNMDNQASGRVLTKAGMRYEGVLRGRALRIGADGYPEDLHICAILATDEPSA